MTTIIVFPNDVRGFLKCSKSNELVICFSASFDDNLEHIYSIGRLFNLDYDSYHEQIKEDLDMCFDEFINVMMLNISLDSNYKVISPSQKHIIIDHQAKYNTVVGWLQFHFSCELEYYGVENNIDKNIVDKFQFLWDHLGV